LIDTHCHLDAAEFQLDRPAVIERAWQSGVQCVVVPSVMPSTFNAVRDAVGQCQALGALKAAQGQHRLVGAYALGSHPLYIHQVPPNATQLLHEALTTWRDDPHLVAVGEIGLDHFVPALQDADSLQQQERLYAEQLAVAASFGLPVILHVRRSADALLKHLRRLKQQGKPVAGGIAHAFNGSLQQAHALLDLGFKLGFGGAMTFDRALQIRALATQLPDDAIVLETDAPDIPPHWLYQTAQARAEGATSSRNEPCELPRIAQTLSALRAWDEAKTRETTSRNAYQALPRLAALLG
jgi:TatD DNase family protein